MISPRRLGMFVAGMVCGAIVAHVAAPLWGKEIVKLSVGWVS